MRTQEEMCVLIQTGNRQDLIPVLWESVQKLYTLKALRYYNRHRERCTACGADLEDIQQQAFFGFLKSIDEYKPDGGLPFTAYINLPFLSAMQELLRYRTASGRNDALNRSESLDREIETEDGGGSTLHDLVPDAHSLDFLEQLDAQSVSEMIRAEVRTLPERHRLTIERSYFDGQTLEQIAAELGTSTERARQIRNEALRKLSHSRNLAELHRAFTHSAQLRRLEDKTRRANDPDAERAYSAAVRNLRECRSVLDSITEEQQACFLWTAGAAMQPTGSAESI